MSFIIPTYNRENFIRDALQSILIETNVAIEVIVIDDGGTDNTASIIVSLDDKRITYLKTKNKERGSARNTGLRNSRGKYVVFFDSDDLFHSNLNNIYSFIEGNGYPPVFFGGIESFSEEGDIKNEGISKGINFRKNLLYNNFLACGSVFLKREVAEEFPFSEDRRLSGTEDWELWLRIYSKYEFVECPFVIFRQRHHKTRSLNDFDVQRITQRENLFADCIRKNWKMLRARFSDNELGLLISDRYTLIALHQSINGSKRESLRQLVKALQSSLLVISRKRFWAVSKKLMLP